MTIKASSIVHASTTVPTHLDAQFTLVDIVPTVATSVPGHARALKAVYHVLACASIHAWGVAALINIRVTVTSGETGSTLTCVAVHFVSTRPVDAGVRTTVVDIGLTVGSGVAQDTRTFVSADQVCALAPVKTGGGGGVAFVYVLCTG